MLKYLLSLLLVAQILTSPAFAGGASGTSTGQQLGNLSQSVVLAAPNTVTATTFTRPSNTTAYVAAQMVANAVPANPTTAVPLSFAIAPGNGVPIYALKAKLITQTSGGASVTNTHGVFRLHLFGTSPTISTSGGDGANIQSNVTFATWCGTLDGTLLLGGSDYSVAEMTPSFGSFVTCTPGGSSQTIYGLLEARDAFVPTSAETFTVSLTAQ